MGTVQSRFNAVYRDYNLDGVEGSGAHYPDKEDIRGLGLVIETYVDGGISTAIGATSALVAAASASATAAANSATQASNQLAGVTKQTVTFTPNGSTTSFALGASGIDARNVDIFIDGVEQRHALWSIVGSNVVFTVAPTGSHGEIRIGGMTSLVEPVSIGDLDTELAGLVTGLRRTIRLWDPQWGIVGDGATNDKTALQAVFDGIPTGESFPTVVDFGSLQIYVGSGLTATGKNIRLVCDGPDTATIYYDQTSGYVLDVDVSTTPTQAFALDGIGFYDLSEGGAATALRVTGAETNWIGPSRMRTQGGCIEIGDDCAMTIGRGWRFDAFGTQPAVKWTSGGGNVQNFFIRKYKSAGSNGPCFWLRGSQVTSLQVANGSLGGTGTTHSASITGITSTSAHFVVTAAGHGYLTGETIVIRNAANSSYNGCYQIDSCDTNTVTILDTRNVGSAGSGGSIDKLHACVAFDNNDGPINETSWSNVLFEGIEESGTAGEIGSVSVLFDGLGNSSLASHRFTGCLYDVGQTAIHAHGKDLGGADMSVQDLHIIGGTTRFVRRGIALRECAGVHISNLAQNCLRGNSAADAASSAGIFLDGNNAQPCRGVWINGGAYGRQSDFRSDVVADRAADYGLLASGAHQDLHIHDAEFYGLVKGTYWPGMSTATRIKASGNTVYSGSGGEEAVAELIIASASSIEAPLLAEQVFFTGSTTIQTITGAHISREIVIGAIDDTSLGASGNIANGAELVAGQTVRLNWSENLGKWMIN